MKMEVILIKNEVGKTASLKRLAKELEARGMPFENDCPDEAKQGEVR